MSGQHSTPQEQVNGRPSSLYKHFCKIICHHAPALSYTRFGSGFTLQAKVKLVPRTAGEETGHEGFFNRNFSTFKRQNSQSSSTA